jgi:hypothetical protein
MTGQDKSYKNFTISVFPHDLKKRLKILAADREQKLYEVVIDCLEIGIQQLEGE